MNDKERNLPSPTQLEEVATNDVLSLKAARRDAIANYLQRLNFDGSIYIHYAAPPYFAGTVITARVEGG